MFVHALTTDRGGCFYYRIRQPLTELRGRGHWTSWGSGVDFETWERSNVLIAQYLNEPSTVENWVRWCEAGEKLCVWEADDDIFKVHTSPAHGDAYDNPETLPRMIRMISAAHLVTVTTPELADVYREHNPNVVVLPNCVPGWMLELPEPRDLEGKHRVRIGYTGSPSHFKDVMDWSPVYRRWMASEWHRTTFAFWGMDRKPDSTPAAHRVMVTPWLRDTRDYLRSLYMDIGVAPVSDTPFNRGKSGIKAQEYAAAGIPCVVSDMPQYRAIVEDGVTGFIARSHSEWIDALRELSDDRGLRFRMGTAAREQARSMYVQSDWIGMWENAYREAAGRIGVRL